MNTVYNLQLNEEKDELPLKETFFEFRNFIIAVFTKITLELELTFRKFKKKEILVPIPVSSWKGFRLGLNILLKNTKTRLDKKKLVRKNKFLYNLFEELWETLEDKSVTCKNLIEFTANVLENEENYRSTQHFPVRREKRFVVPEVKIFSTEQTTSIFNKIEHYEEFVVSDEYDPSLIYLKYKNKYLSVKRKNLNSMKNFLQRKRKKNKIQIEDNLLQSKETLKYFFSKNSNLSFLKKNILKRKKKTYFLSNNLKTASSLKKISLLNSKVKQINLKNNLFTKLLLKRKIEKTVLSAFFKKQTKVFSKENISLSKKIQILKYGLKSQINNSYLINKNSLRHILNYCSKKSLLLNSYTKEKLKNNKKNDFKILYLKKKYIYNKIQKELVKRLKILYRKTQDHLRKKKHKLKKKVIRGGRFKFNMKKKRF